MTREPFRHRGRISHLLENGTLARDVGLPPIARETDRFMLCGSVQMLADLRTILQRADLTEGSTTLPGAFVVEKAFVEWQPTLGDDWGAPLSGASSSPLLHWMTRHWSNTPPAKLL